MDPRIDPFKQTLTARLKTAREVALLAVGSELRGDDAVALRVAALLDEGSNRPAHLHVFLGTNAPENCTGPIRRVNPSHLLVIDAADMQAEPGTMALLDVARLSDVSFCTHALPLSVIINYIVSSCQQCEVIVVGVQPAQLEFGRALSPSAEAAAQQLATVLRSALNSQERSDDV